MDAYVGTILLWPMSWAPVDWMLCDGSLLPIAQYQMLFALSGTTYGGDGRTSFALPDLRGRMPMGAGNGPGLTSRQLGGRYGAEGETLTAHNMPAHTHTLAAGNTDSASLTQAPASGWTLGAAASNTGGRTPIIAPVQMYSASAPATPVQSAATSVAGSTSPSPVATVSPALCLNFIICFNGIYPQRP